MGDSNMTEAARKGICFDWIHGKCRFGANCKFRHDHGGQQQQDMQQSLYKTRMCPLFLRGVCKFGNSCSFAHSEAELRPLPHLEGPGHMQQQGSFPMPPQGMGPGGAFPADAGPMMGAPSASGSDFAAAGGAPGAARFQQQQQQQQGSMASSMGGPGMMPGTWPGVAGPRPPPGPPPDDAEPSTSTLPAQPLPSAASASASGGPQQLPQVASTASTTMPAARPTPAAAAVRDVPYLDRVRAVCALLNIGEASKLLEAKQDATKAAIAHIKNGQAFKESPFADGVEAYLTPAQ